MFYFLPLDAIYKTLFLPFLPKFFSFCHYTYNCHKFILLLPTTAHKVNNVYSSIFLLSPCASSASQNKESTHSHQLWASCVYLGRYNVEKGVSLRWLHLVVRSDRSPWKEQARLSHRKTYRPRQTCSTFVCWTEEGRRRSLRKSTGPSYQAHTSNYWRGERDGERMLCCCAKRTGHRILWIPCSTRRPGRHSEFPRLCFPHPSVRNRGRHALHRRGYHDRSRHSELWSNGQNRPIASAIHQIRRAISANHCFNNAWRSKAALFWRL